MKLKMLISLNRLKNYKRIYDIVSITFFIILDKIITEHEAQVRLDEHNGKYKLKM
jgi:hypothetical protein